MYSEKIRDKKKLREIAEPTLTSFVNVTVYSNLFRMLNAILFLQLLLIAKCKN
jgi:hypothetical protein